MIPLLLARLATAGVTVEVAPPPTDPSEVLFDGRIHEIALEVDAAGWQSLVDEPETWVPAALTWGGVTWEPVGLRVKGENSFQQITDKPSLKIQLDQYADFRLLGLDRITLNNMATDPTKLHERVSYWAYRELGVPASRAGYARLTLNGEPYGLYALLEDVTPDMAARWYPEPLGTMWEMTDADFDETYEGLFEHEFGVLSDAPLYAVTDALALGGDPAYAALDIVLDWDEVLDYFAISAVIAQNDAYPYRYPGDDCHWYLDPTTGLLQVLPHGLDESFNTSGWPGILEMSGQLPWFCLGNATCDAELRARIWSAHDALVAGGLYAEALAARDAILWAVALDTNDGADTLTVYLDQLAMLDFIAAREADVAAQVGPRP